MKTAIDWGDKSSISGETQLFLGGFEQDRYLHPDWEGAAQGLENIAPLWARMAVSSNVAGKSRTMEV